VRHPRTHIPTLMNTSISGIPCLIEITHYKKVKGDPNTWASDWDFYGYTEIEFTVCDRRGRPAPWLDKKVTPEIKAELENEIEGFMQ